MARIIIPRFIEVFNEDYKRSKHPSGWEAVTDDVATFVPLEQVWRSLELQKRVVKNREFHRYKRMIAAHGLAPRQLAPEWSVELLRLRKEWIRWTIFSSLCSSSELLHWTSFLSAVSLFAWAALFSFIGVALYVILWVIVTPPMFVTFLVGGAFFLAFRILAGAARLPFARASVYRILGESV